MIENFLRPPRGAGEWAADAVRVIGALSVIAAFIGWSATDGGIVALSVPALLVPRFIGARPWFDIVSIITVIVAAWSNVLDLYTAVPGWDLVVHFACTGVLAILLYLGLSHLGITAAPATEGFTRRAALVLVTTFGLALSALWEMVEWLGKTFVTDAIFVTYDDSIGDMAIGGLGAVMAGVLLSRVRLTRR